MYQEAVFKPREYQGMNSLVRSDRLEIDLVGSEMGRLLSLMAFALALGCASAAAADEPQPALPNPDGDTIFTAPIATGTHTCPQSHRSTIQAGEIATAVSYVISTDGSVSGAAVARSSGNGDLDQDAVDCVAHWTYTPYKFKGQPRAVSWLTNISFPANSAVPKEIPISLTTMLSDEDCAHLYCRPAGATSVIMRDETASLSIPHSPYVTRSDVIIAFPGEKLDFGFTPTAANIGHPYFYSTIDRGKPTSTAPRPDHELVVLMIPFTTVKTDMSIQISHNFPQGIAFDMIDTVITPNGLVVSRMPVCKLMPKRMPIMIPAGMPGPIFLTNFRFMSDADPPNSC
jgi:TonB family protein